MFYLSKPSSQSQMSYTFFETEWQYFPHFCMLCCPILGIVGHAVSISGMFSALSHVCCCIARSCCFTSLVFSAVPEHWLDLANRLNRYLFIDTVFHFSSRYFGITEAQILFPVKCQFGLNRLVQKFIWFRIYMQSNML